MTDNEFKALAGKAPPPDAAAKRKALALAMQAFDQADQEKTAPTQGFSIAARLSHIATSIWSGLMKQRLMIGSALATLMILPAAGYITWQITQDLQRGQAVMPAPMETRLSAKVEEAEDVAQPGSMAAGEAGHDAEAQSPDLNEMAPPPPMAAAPQSVQRPINPVGALQQGMRREQFSAQSRNDYGLANAQRQPEAVASHLEYPAPQMEAGRDRVEAVESNSVKSVAEEPVSTFSADVDTSSYAMMRRTLKQGLLPDPETVRVEELVNYFPYAYPGPETAETPFRATVTVTPTPWNAHTKLLHIGVKGYDVAPAQRPRANLVFLIDVSGSMNEADKLPLLKSAFRLLVNKLDPEDTVSIVTYAGDAGTVLEPTPVSQKRTILDAMEQLRPGGSTAGAAGLDEAYRLAEKAFVKDGVNRVMLATDGDFNVGPSGDDALKAMIEAKRESGVFLSVFGFGQGNYNDQLMQTIAQNGNGVAAYIDTLSEAEKTFVQEASASLFPIASDVKFQIEFNPAVVAEYRQIGFETRALKREDFNNDLVDAGEIGSGHTVTAIYEITPVGSPAILNSDLRYGDAAKPAPGDHGGELAFLKIRAKTPGEAESRLTEIPVTSEAGIDSLDAASEDVRFSIAVAAFGQKLRKTDQLAGYDYAAIEKMASDARGADPYGYRSEFV
ncbi:MAG: VWA domain-containing protein, partial [Hoeflea sp.]|nr:VWA domain-containing protein [Hoeflea sp.]